MSTLLQRLRAPGGSQAWIAVAIVGIAYVAVVIDRLQEVPDAFRGFGFHPQVLLRASWATQMHLLAGFVAMALGVFQLRAPKGTPRHRALGYAWVTVMLALCGSALAMKQHFGLLQMLAVIVIGLLAKAVWHARRHEVAQHSHLMRVLVLGATLAVGLFTAVPGRISWQLFFAGAPASVPAATR